MGTLNGIIRDGVSGDELEAKVHVLTSWGTFVHPSDSILKIGYPLTGQPFFYCPGRFTVDVQRGSTDVVVERGIEYEPLRQVVNMPDKGSVDVEFSLKRWIDLPSMHWYSGNTHIHYIEEKLEPHALLIPQLLMLLLFLER